MYFLVFNQNYIEINREIKAKKQEQQAFEAKYVSLNKGT